MSGSLNKVTLIGNLGKDPEMRSTQDGRRIATFSMAMSESWKDKASGERKERTQWATVVIFNTNLAEIAEKYLRKGSKVYVEGAFQTRKWTDQSGQDRYSTEVVLQAYGGQLILLGGGAGRTTGPASEDDYGGAEAGYGSGNGQPARPAADPAKYRRDDLDQDIPF